MDEYWEPVTFNIGDIVRINLSEECNTKREEIIMASGHELMRHDAGNRSHPRIYDGAVGVVVNVIREKVQAGHFYRVGFLCPIPYKNIEYRGADFAWSELSIITMKRRLTTFEEESLQVFCYMAQCDVPAINYKSVEKTTI